MFLLSLWMNFHTFCFFLLIQGIVSIVFSLRVDRLYDSKITWTEKYKDAESQEYQQLEHEAVRAVRVVTL